MKTHVAMEYKHCIICGVEFESGAVLLNKKLAPVFDDTKHTVTGFAICPDCLKQTEAGYIALIEIDVKKSGGPTESASPSDVWRTGRVGWIKREYYQVVSKKPTDKCCVYVEMGVLELLQGEQEPHHTVQ